MFVNNALKMNGGQFINNIKREGQAKTVYKKIWSKRNEKQKSDEENIIIDTMMYC